MTGEAVTFRSLLARALNHWRTKLASLVAAVLVWLFVTSSNVTTTQRTMTLPLVVEGVSEGQLAAGLPTMVEVSVSGPGPRVDRLRTDMFRATLDLSDAAGAFERPITVQSPPEIQVVEVVPADIIGFIESVTSRQMPVAVALSGALPADRLLTPVVSPATAVVTGRALVLDRVATVLAVTPVTGGTARLVVLDSEGEPIEGLRVAPETVAVSVQGRSALVTRTVTIDLQSPDAPTLDSVTLSASAVELAGEAEVLAGIAEVVGTVEAPTGEVAPGRYTLPIRLALPPGVVALSVPTATLQYLSTPPEP